MSTSADRPTLSPANAPGGARIPDFFIVGHAKCGTTALYEALRRHPDIFMPRNKEPWYFARSNPHPQLHGERSIEFTGRKKETREEYLANFAEARRGQLIGEGSTSYLWSDVAAAEIAKAQPSARIIALLREPAAFLRSLHLQRLTDHIESEIDFARALALDDERRAGREIPKYAFWPQTIIYSDQVRYVEQLRRYEEVFAPEQILVLIYEDYRHDNDATLKRVLRFLGVDEHPSLGLADTHTTWKRVRSNRVNDLARMLNQGRGPISGVLNSSIKRVTTPAFRKQLLWPVYDRVLFGRPRPADEALMVEIRRRFKPEVVALSEHLDRDMVKFWGYDAID
jgi:Sulfotransferase family